MLELFDEFYCVASYLSITKAAAMLNMSQPNLSRHVRQLERETGFELLDRSSGCVKLTGAGRKVADGYPDIRRQLTELIEDCRRFAASPIKQITAHEPPYMDNVIGPYYEYLGKLNEQGARIGTECFIVYRFGKLSRAASSMSGLRTSTAASPHSSRKSSPASTYATFHWEYGSIGTPLSANCAK